MALPGQASGGFTESSSDLRVLYVGYRNSFSAELTDDAFTQANPVIEPASSTVSSQFSSSPPKGILSATVAFTRGDAGNGFVGGPSGTSWSAGDPEEKPVGMFLNPANGYDFENKPADASDQGTYAAGQGTLGVRLWETQKVGPDASGSGSQGDNLDYKVGYDLYASVSGLLTSAATGGNAADLHDDIWEIAGSNSSYGAGGAASTDLSDATQMGIVKITADATHDEMIFDFRI